MSLEVTVSKSGPISVTVPRETLEITVERTGRPGVAGVGVANAMSDLIYEPRGIESDVFNAANLTGNIDGGTFA